MSELVRASIDFDETHQIDPIAEDNGNHVEVGREAVGRQRVFANGCTVEFLGKALSVGRVPLPKMR